MAKDICFGGRKNEKGEIGLGQSIENPDGIAGRATLIPFEYP